MNSISGTIGILITDSQRLQHPVKWRKSAVMSDKYRLVNGNELYNIIEDPSQQNDIAEQHPEMVKQYREVYEVWWTDVSERFDEYAGIIIGSKFEKIQYILQVMIGIQNLKFMASKTC